VGSIIYFENKEPNEKEGIENKRRQIFCIMDNNSYLCAKK
jgi:hypothetical protein